MSLWATNAGVLTLDFHPGQARAWESARRFVVMLAGTQGGKTSFEPWWLWREIQRRGSGDYLAVTATFDMFKLKFLPTLREVFEQVLRIGRYWNSDRIIEIADPATGQFRAQKAGDPMWARIILRSAETQGGLESATALAALLDEAGLYEAGTWDAILRRLSLSMGRVLIGTTLYNLGWIKTRIYDKWAAHDPDFDVIQFDSTANPTFPQAEMERARREMPLWKFNMQYRGRLERPPGLIYDAFNEADVIPPFALPATWPRHLGLDFGGVHTAGIFFAEEPNSPYLYLYREYLAGGRTAKEHTGHLLAGEPHVPTCVGGSKSEGQWRDEFAYGGLPVAAPYISDVEVGIDRVYGAHKRREIRVFNTCTGYLAQKRSYSRVLDVNGEATPAIEAKATYHYLDAERYIIGRLRPGDSVPGVLWLDP